MHPGDSERRLAAILNADVVGFSRLMAEDEQATVEAMEALRQRVAERVPAHHGRLVDFTGDNFLAEFPSALDSVACALQIQRDREAPNAALPEPRRVELRIGVHLGDVRAEGDHLFGSGVNVAARLQALAEPGRICISAPVREQVRGRLPLDYEDLGAPSAKNLPEPVRAFQIRACAASASRSRGHHPVVRRRRRLLGAGLVVLGLLLACSFAVWASWPLAPGLLLDRLGLGVEPGTRASPPGASVAVLPFATLGEEARGYLAAGLTEDLTTDLYGIPDLLVVSRNSAFAYAAPPVDVHAVGRELGVRYLLQGTVRESDDRIRVTVSLTDAASGARVWSQRYDRVLDDVLALQSEISEEILAALNLQVEEAELDRIRRKPTDSLSAYEAVKRANAFFYQFRRDTNQRARALYARAIELDPGYAEPYALQANTYNYEFTGGWNQDPRLLDTSEGLVRRALDLDPLSPEALASLTAVAIARGRWAEAVDAGRRCVELAPSYDFGHFLLGMAQRGSGRPLAAFQSLRRGLRLDPRGQAPTLAFLADLNYRAGRVEEAVGLWERIRRENPHHVATRLALAQHREKEGRLDEARALLREVLHINPSYRADRARLPGGRALSESETAALTEHLRTLRADPAAAGPGSPSAPRRPGPARAR